MPECGDKQNNRAQGKIWQLFLFGMHHSIRTWVLGVQYIASIDCLHSRFDLIGIASIDMQKVVQLLHTAGGVCILHTLIPRSLF